MMQNIIDLSEGWTYRTAAHIEPTLLETLRTGPYLEADETLTLTRKLDEEMKNAALLICANHQSINVFLDSIPLLFNDIEPGKNPGMALYILQLPEDYKGKTITLEITSPFNLYSGRTSPIMLSTIPSLEAWILSCSMRSVMLMAMCLFVGICTLVTAFFSALKGTVHPDNLVIGIFAVIWAIYYVCTEYISYQFFSPQWMSLISLGLYFSFAIPLTLFFYFSFNQYKQLVLPLALLYIAFAATALTLQTFGVMDLPRLINLNNFLLTGLLYTIALIAMEARNGNKKMILALPFIGIAYITMMYNFYIFYTRKGSVPYSYKDTYFLLIICILAYNIFDFFYNYINKLREKESLERLNQLKNIFLMQISHEMKTPLTIISNSAELTRMQLETGNTDRETFSILSNIAMEAQRLGRLTEKFMDMGLENQELVILQPINLLDVIERVAAVAVPIFSKNNNRLEIRAPLNLPKAYANTDMITQVFLNLFTNANRHCYNGIITLSAKLEENTIKISFSDNGNGIAPESLSGVFAWGKSNDGSTGYGLAITKQIIENHSGTIKIESEVGHGTSIQFSLPVYKEENDEHCSTSSC